MCVSLEGEHVEVRGQYWGGVNVPRLHSCTPEPHPNPPLIYSFVSFVLLGGARSSVVALAVRGLTM